MNFLTEHPSSHLKDFFFRTADRMRVEGCANAIAKDGLSLVLYSPHEALLDHYLGLLLERLRRQSPEPRIEVYFPTNTESLIARFNDVLNRQSVKQATQKPQHSDSSQIWIVHDTQRLPDQEIQLMARLIQNFPGANIRAILLMTGNNPKKSSLSALGRKVLRWDIEAPTQEQAQLALELAAQNGQLHEVTQLLQNIGHTSRNTLDLGDEIPADSLMNTVPDPRDPLKEAGQSERGFLASLWPLSEAREPRTSSIAASRTAKRKPQRLKAVARAGFLLLFGVMVCIQPHAFKSATQDRIAVPSGSVAAVSSPVAKAEVASEPAVEVPDESLQTQAWVRALPPSSFLIQHGSLDTYEKALAVKSTLPKKAQAKIVAAYRAGEELAHFVIVSGPFASIGQAHDTLKHRDASKNSWVRMTRTLQQQLNAPTRAKESLP